MGRPKRKEQSGSPVNENDPSKRMRQTPASPDISDAKSVAEFGQDVLKVVNELRGNRGKRIAIEFRELPSKEELPDYYEDIKNPIALDTIESKLSSYASAEELLEDFKLMAKNAVTYNEDTSDIVKNANKIRDTVEQLVIAYTGKPTGTTNGANTKVQTRGSSGSTAEGEARRQAMLGVLKSLQTDVKDEHGESAAYHFLKRVSARQYPDYYELIKEPICLNDIRKKLEKKDESSYSDESIVEEFEDDVLLLVANARAYNEEGSVVLNDAMTLTKYFIPRIAEERKKLGLPSRPLGGSDEDTVMANGVEFAPKIVLKVNGGKKAASPASFQDVKQTTAVSSPSATSNQSPPPGADPLGIRHPFKKSYSPFAAAASPNLRNTSSISPMLPSATMVPPTSAMSPPAAPPKPVITKPVQPKLPDFVTFKLSGPLSGDGMIVQPSTGDSWDRRRKPGTTAADSPIQKLRVSTSPRIKPPHRFKAVIKPVQESYECGHLYPLPADNSLVLIEPFLHPKLAASKSGYGIWLKHGGTPVLPTNPREPKDGLLHVWELQLAPGQPNKIEVVCDMLLDSSEGSDQKETLRSTFWVTLVPAKA